MDGRARVVPLETVVDPEEEGQETEMDSMEEVNQETGKFFQPKTRFGKRSAFIEGLNMWRNGGKSVILISKILRSLYLLLLFLIGLCLVFYPVLL